MVQEMELSTTSILSLFETDKSQRKSFVNDVLNRLDNGIVNPLEVHLQIKAMEDIITQLTSSDEKKNKNIKASEKYKQYLADAFKENAGGQKSFDFHNARFTQMETGSKWQYEKTEDFILPGLYDQMEKLKAKIKDRETFLQSLPTEGMDLLNGDTGEMVKVYKPYKTSTTSVSVTLK